jgi:hypothetical protein
MAAISGTTRSIERKRLPRGLVQPPVFYADHFKQGGVDLFKAACERDLEGIGRNWLASVMSWMPLPG